MKEMEKEKIAAEQAPAVFAAICKVQGELAKAGISKENRNVQQGYKFRGIDDIYNAIAPLLSKYSLCIVPQVTERSQVERHTKTGVPLFYTTVKVHYLIASAEDGSCIYADVCGEAMDSGDKSTNKAMSAAYKYLCLQLFCIPTEGDNDPDATSYDVAAQVKRITPEQIAEFGALNIDLDNVAKAYGVADYKMLTEAQAADAIDRKKKNIKAAAQLGGSK